ncbi:hypothetical protein M406DRAFT_321812 [Cryphonectria parasitica EP155]|uniref:Rhodopsin domain-containing protein n=1 Tax=Cryphonectria parasitica (strain ATCC 38755 / EP155) TaxID=660469 RepID=A0A9P4Y7R5_CRYP1|nr:uncharacterized protein M406DRAFT_321812 [Cryphonectria parasitica EP155]KAF3767984.1 hypothetical protein M406DRAFT_321812 [Cryphonectria parasitica EP155]
MHPRAVLLVAPVTAFYILGLAAIGLRIWARHIKKVSWRLSDYTILIAAVFGTGYVAMCWLAATRGGIGYPLVRVPLTGLLVTRKAFFVGWLLQCWANSFVRLSILDFIHQVFAIRKFRFAVYVCEAATVAYLVACTIALLATCRPFEYNWELGPEVTKHCSNLSLKFLLSSIFNLALDLSILILPMPMLWTLQMSTRKKIAISFVFGLGIFVCFATAWRTYEVVEFSKPASQLNFTETIVEDALWSGLEITLGIINACLPVMQPAAQRIFNIPFIRLISFSTNRSAKNSKMSADSSTPFKNSRFPSWVRLGSSKSESKVGIQREVEYSVDIESDSGHRIPMENMGSTTKLSTQNPTPYHRSLTNQYFAGDPRS